VEDIEKIWRVVIMTETRAAIILAAGEGKRLHPFTQSNPKCFAEVAGRKIIEHALRALAEQNCQRVCIVVGHLAERIHEVIGDEYGGISIEYVYNPLYRSTNTMYSLYLGLTSQKEASWIIEGDIIFDQHLIDSKPYAPIVWFVDSSTRHLDGAFVETNDDNVVISLEIVRKLELLRPRQHKSVGILHLQREGVDFMKAWLQQGVKDGREKDYYDLILRDHLSEAKIQAMDIAGRHWSEVDTLEDLEHARLQFVSGGLQWV
jgi:choline kinase